MKKAFIVAIFVLFGTFLVAGFLFFFSGPQKLHEKLPSFGVITESPVSPPPTISLSAPTTTPVSEEELKKLWLGGERCSQKSFFSRGKELVKLDFGQFFIDGLEVHFTDDATCKDVERIALLLNAKISGFDSISNLYEFQISTRTVEELEKAIKRIEALADPKIKFVSKVIRYKWIE